MSAAAALTTRLPARISMLRIRLHYVRADRHSIDIVGWWPSTAAATRTAEADGAVFSAAQVLSDLSASVACA